MQLIYTNAATLLTPYVGEHHGHIGIIMKPMLYATLSNMECSNPSDPEVYHTMPPNTTQNHRNQL